MTTTRKPAPEGSRFARVRIPGNKNTATTAEPRYVDSTAVTGQFTCRRQAAQRLARLECGCADPWTHRCGDRPDATDREIDAYAAAAELLASLGYPPAPLLPELRGLWRRGERGLVASVTSRWAVR